MLSTGAKQAADQNEKDYHIPWYTEEAGFFGQEYLEQNAHDLTRECTLKEANFLEDVLKHKGGVNILDCMCGQGRHAIELAQRGYNVTGLDLNGELLQKAIEASKSLLDSGAPPINFVKRDIREHVFEGEFDVALNLYTSFGYFEDRNEDQKALNQIIRALKQGGIFIFDAMNREQVLRNYRKRHWRELSDGSLLVIHREFDPFDGSNNEKRVRIWKNGKQKNFAIRFRLYTLTELLDMFHRAGLTPLEVYGSFDGGPVTIDSSRYVLVATKK